MLGKYPYGEASLGYMRLNNILGGSNGARLGQYKLISDIPLTLRIFLAKLLIYGDILDVF